MADRSFEEWQALQNMPRANTEGRPLSEIVVGDIVEEIPDRPFCTGGKTRVIEVTEHEIVTHGGSRWDRKTGAALQEPWAYHL
jgi:hypothetical protein